MTHIEFGCPTVKFTDHPNPMAENRVRADIDRIIDAVMHEISPRAIILAGSFGRGEGSVRVEGNDVHVLSDYEVGVVTGKIWKRSRIVRLSNRLSEQLGAQVSLFWVTMDRLKNNRIKNLSFGNRPTIFAYDLKAGSVLLYGGLNLRKNRISPESLPPWEGYKLLINRLAEFVLQADYKRFRDWVEGGASGSDLPIAKSLLSAADGLIVISNDYVPSARKRLDNFLDQKPFDLDISRVADSLANALDHRIHEAEWRGIYWEDYSRFMFEALRILVEKTFNLKIAEVALLPKSMQTTPVPLDHFVQYDPGWLPISPVRFEIMNQRRKLKNAGLRVYFESLNARGMIPSLSMFSMIPGIAIVGDQQSPETILRAFLDKGTLLEDHPSNSQEIWDRWDALRQLLLPIWKVLA